MATSTLVQKLDGTALESSKTVPGSYSSVSTPDVSNRSQVETFKLRLTAASPPTGATKTINKGAWVVFDYDQSGDQRVLCVEVQDTSGGAVAIGVPVLGVALDTVTVTESSVAGGVTEASIRVVVGGYVETAAVSTGSTKGLALSCDTTNSGRASIADAANVNICGVALADAVSNVAPCWVFKQF